MPGKAPAKPAIILLMGAAEAEFCNDILHMQADCPVCIHASSRERLVEICAETAPGSRLIAFSTNIVAPASVLAHCRHNGYNFHPGPPDYPGSRPSAFATYDNAARFGVTLHRMREQVDSGAIVATDFFPIRHFGHASEIALEAYKRLLSLFIAWAPALAAITHPLPTTDLAWRGAARREAEYQALRRIAPDAETAEIRRRMQACDGVYCPLD